MKKKIDNGIKKKGDAELRKFFNRHERQNLHRRVKKLG